MGDEIGLGNDTGWEADPAHAGDNRWAHRPPMDWGGVDTGVADATSVEGRLLRRFADLARERAVLAPLGAGPPPTVLDLGDDGVFGYVRGPVDGRRVTAVVDASGAGRTIVLPPGPGSTVAHCGAGGATLTGSELTLPPYGTRGTPWPAAR